MAIRVQRTAPVPAFIATPTAIPDSLRRGESAAIGLEVINGDGSPSDMDGSAILSLSLSSTELGELYLNGQPQGGAIDSIAVVDLIGDRVRFVAHDAEGPGGTVRISSTAHFAGDTGSGFIDVPVVPDELLVTADPEAVGYGEQTRIRVEGQSFRGEPVALDPQTLVTLDLTTGRYGSLYRESDSLGRGAQPRLSRAGTKSTGTKSTGASAARDITLADIPLAEFETDPVWFRVLGESPPADTTITVVATSEQYAGSGELTVQGGALDHLAVFFETPGGARSDTLRHGDQYAHVVVEGRTADNVPLWLDPTLELLLEIEPALADSADAPASLAYDGGRLVSAVTVDQPFCLRAAPSCVQVEALVNPVGRDPLPFTLTATVVDSAAVVAGVRTGYVQEDYYLHLAARPDTLLMGQRALLDLKATSKRPERDTLELPAETAFGLSILLANGGGSFAVEGAGEPAQAVAVSAGDFAEGRVAYVADGFLPAGVDAGWARLLVQREGDFHLQGEETVTLWPGQLLSQREVWPTLPRNRVWSGSSFSFDPVDSVVDSVKVRVPGGSTSTAVRFKAEWVVGSGGHTHGGNDPSTLVSPPADLMWSEPGMVDNWTAPLG